jgi:hypothetical protein
MKNLMLAIGFFSIGVLSCTNESFDNSLNGTWTVYSFENLTTATTEYKTQENSWNKEIQVQIDETKNPKNISGTNTTNQISGELSLVAQNQFIVSNLASTKVNQPRWADEFITALLDPNLTFEVSYNKLVIYYANNTKRVTLNRN